MKGPRSKIEGPLRPDLPDDATVKVIGLGGVGSIVARYVSVFLGSLDRNVRLVLIDGDEFEPANASRMLFSDYGNKADVVRAELRDRLADSSVSLMAIPEYVTSSNIDRLVRDGDIVLLTVDNHATRKLVSDHAATLENLWLISGGNDGAGKDSSGQRQRGTYGNCQIYIRRGGEDVSPSLSRFHPEIREPADHAPDEESCTELIKSVPQILFTNLAVASSILNAFWLYGCGALHYSELSFDIADGLMRPTMPL
jgi:molybdopterin/thiamine biosynthesis adenylyltransferase